jgi:toxin ParE1/3/4
VNYTLIIKPLAQVDIEEAALWYEDKSIGLGSVFLQEMEDKLLIIEQNPNLFEIKYKSVHQAFLYRFPFSIHYIIDREIIFVIAILHTNRNPQMIEERNK